MNFAPIPTTQPKKIRINLKRFDELLCALERREACSNPIATGPLLYRDVRKIIPEKSSELYEAMTERQARYCKLVDRGYTQQEVAEKYGVHRVTVAKVIAAGRANQKKLNDRVMRLMAFV